MPEAKIISGGAKHNFPKENGSSNIFMGDTVISEITGEGGLDRSRHWIGDAEIICHRGWCSIVSPPGRVAMAMIICETAKHNFRQARSIIFQKENNDDQEWFKRFSLQRFPG